MNETMEQPAGTAREFGFEFRGSGSEYFRIWIVNLLLSILTLGIYSAWAKVRRLRYFYGNTYLDGTSFEYHGRPVAILKGRLVAVGVYVLYLVCTKLAPLLALAVLAAGIFGFPWIIMRSRLFQLRMSSYRNIRFNFFGNYADALGAYIGWAILAALTAYLLTPTFLWKRVNYTLGNAAYGRTRFRFVTERGTFYRFFFASVGLAILLGAAFAILMGALGGVGGVAAAPGGGRAPMAALARLFAGPAALAALAAIAGALGIAGYYRKSFVNASFGGVEVGSARLRSRLESWPLIGIYLTNLLGIVFTLGLFYPWAKVRQLRYQLEHTAVALAGGFDAFKSDPAESASAVGEEIGDFFNVDFGL